MSELQLDNFIDGRFVPARSGGRLPVYEPATGAIYAQVARSQGEDIQQAVAAAERAFPAWKALTPDNRAAFLYALAARIESKLDFFAEAESQDNGKPVSLARTVDIPRSAANLRFFAAAITQFATECHATSPEVLNYTLRQPLGVVGCISPWNLPLYLFTWKIAPALAAGNCVVAKPSEVTPHTATLFAELCQEVGLPAGVFNLVHGTGPEAGESIVTHPKIKAVSFTGGTKTGARIAQSAAPLFKKLSLELGGKNPVLIFDDCDFENMLSTTLRSSFANQGEICLCGSRILVQESIYDRFRARFLEAAKALVVGDPRDPATMQGAIVSAEHHANILSRIALARSEGGKVLLGGEAVNPGGRCEKGWFVAPTIIEGVSANCRTFQEEIFGPVVTLHKFRTESEALELADATSYGLASVIWTSSLDRAHRLAGELHSGIVWVNCWMLRDLRTPFGGVKQSGVGREGGVEALRFFTEPKNICLQLGRS